MGRAFRGRLYLRLLFLTSSCSFHRQIDVILKYDSFTRLCNSSLFITITNVYNDQISKAHRQKGEKKFLNPVHFCQTETLLDLQRAGGWERLLHKNWITWQACRLVLCLLPRFHSEWEPRKQENICFDLLLFLKVWFSFVIVFCAPYLSRLLFLQPNKLAIEYNN